MAAGHWKKTSAWLHPTDLGEKFAEQIAGIIKPRRNATRCAQKRRGGTSGLSLTLKEIFDELDAMPTVYYRELYEVWKAAQRRHTG